MPFKLALSGKLRNDEANGTALLVVRRPCSMSISFHYLNSQRRSECLVTKTTLLVVIGVLLLPALAEADDKASDVVLAIHGGAGVVSRELGAPGAEKEYRAKLREAIEAGRAVIEKGDGDSVGAVVAAIKVLEDSPLFNAGKGAAFNHEGQNEMDASIMDGGRHKAGAVAAVRTIKNPITAARAVMDQSKHVLLVGTGADSFAREHGLEIVDPSYFRTELRWNMLQEQLRKEKRAIEKPSGEKPSKTSQSRGGGVDSPLVRFGTVGCVALDRRGNLAAGTSTGGLTAKLPGRVGDSPLIGAGTFADNANCAVSATGDGEYFIRAAAAHDIAALVEYKNLSVAEASRIVIHDKIKPAGGEGGVIVLDRAGNLAMTYSSEGMFRAYLTRDGEIHVLIFAK
jgi:L-asparaginase / beta-aspartyl-peptidase